MKPLFAIETMGITIHAWHIVIALFILVGAFIAIGCLCQKIKDYFEANKKKNEEKPDTKSEEDTDKIYQLDLVTFQVMEGQEDEETPDMRAVVKSYRPDEPPDYFQWVRQNGEWRFLEDFMTIDTCTCAEDLRGGRDRTQEMIEDIECAIAWEQKYGPRKDLEFGSEVPVGD